MTASNVSASDADDASAGDASAGDASAGGATASVPEGELVYAVGDVHGRADLLSALLAQIEDDAARTVRERNLALGAEAAPLKKTLVFIGDFVDRGHDSKGAVETLLHGLPEGFTAHFIKGNHEKMMLDFLDVPDGLELWRVNGGEETMRSYGVDVDKLSRTGAPPQKWHKAFVKHLPQDHRDFFETLELHVPLGDYLFVHAGVRPGVPLEAQDERDALWIRHEFLEAADPFGKTIVHGHTPELQPVVKPNRIGIDTGAVFTGALTALRLEGDTVRFLQTGLSATRGFVFLQT